MEGAIHDVSDTALWVAVYRAEESARPDALFHDPLAEKLAGERGREIARNMPSGQIVAWTLVMRTMVIDEMIHTALKEGADMIVNLGAGLDTRPFRMDIPASLRWVEVDFPNMIAYKNSKLAGETPRCRLERIPLDLSGRVEREKLFARLSGEARKICVITEGVIPYLTPEQVAELADGLHSHPAFHFWIQDFYSKEAMNEAHRAQKKSLRNAPFRFAVDDWLKYFGARGWMRKDSRSLYDQSERVRRPIGLPLIWRWTLALPGAKARMRSATGCVLFERS